MAGASDLVALVPRWLVGWTATDPDRRWATERGSLVSADLSGFTALSERLAAKGRIGAEELTATVNRCFTALIEGAEHDGGDVLKFGGDALLLWFDGDGHEARGVRAAARMQAAIGRRGLRSARLQMSVGVATGELFAFLVGSPQRELLLAGPLASRTTALETAADAGTVLVDAEVAAAVPVEWLRDRAADRAEVAVDRVDLSGPPRALPLVPAAVDLRALIPGRVAAHLSAVAAGGGEHRLASIAFIGIDDLDARLTEHGPAMVADQLDDLVTTVQAVADEYGVAALASDVMTGGIKLILAAGVPTSGGEDEEAMLRAVRAAADQTWGGTARVGVHRGPVFAGFLGAPSRRTYTVMGDAVNLAARLMGKATHGQIVASDDVMVRSRSHYELEALAPFLVKGKTAPIVAHLVGPRVEAREEAPRARDLDLVGRGDQLATLRDAVGRAIRSEGAAVEIVGEAGVGKTRLVQELVADRRALVHYGVDCQPYDTLTAYASLRPILRSIADIAVDAPSSTAGAELLDWLRAVAPDQLPLAPLLAVPFGADVPGTAEADAVASTVRQRRTEEVLVDVLEAALATPTLLVVEDTYYIDEASRLLVCAIARALPGHPWLLCITRRPDTPGVVDETIPGDLMLLDPLREAEASALVDAAVGDMALTDDVLERLIDRAGGNPLFLLSLIESMRDRDHDDIPETIERLVAARIDSLPPSDLLLLRHAAVVGRTFDLALVAVAATAAGLAGAAGTTRWNAMDEFLEAAGPRAYTFRHALFRDAAYAGLPFGHRRHVHAALAEHLAVTTPDGATPPTGLIATHYYLADLAEPAFTWSVRAGDQAMAHHTVAEAAAAFERALEVGRRARAPRSELARVWEAMADALFRAGRYGDARRALGRAIKLVEGPAAAVARLFRKQGEVRERLGNLGAATRWFNRARSAIGDAPTGDEQRELIVLELAFGGIRLRQGRTREARAHLTRAIAEGTAAGEERSVARACYISVGVTGDPDEDQRRAQRGLEIYERIDDPSGHGHMWNNLGVVAYFDGRWTDAAACWDRARELFARAGESVAAAVAGNNQGEILADQGRYVAADREFRYALRVCTAAGYEIGVAVAIMNSGRLAARQVDLETATAHFEDAERRFTRMGVTAYQLECIVGRADVALRRGRLDETEDLAHRVLAADADGGGAEESVICRGQRLLGWVALQRGDLDGSARWLATAVATAEADGLGFEAAQGLAALAIVARRRDDSHAEAYEAESEQMFLSLDVHVRPWAPVS